jgi:hypothetical protein
LICIYLEKYIVAMGNSNPYYNDKPPTLLYRVRDLGLVKGFKCRHSGDGKVNDSGHHCEICLLFVCEICAVKYFDNIYLCKNCYIYYPECYDSFKQKNGVNMSSEMKQFDKLVNMSALKIQELYECWSRRKFGELSAFRIRDRKLCEASMKLLNGEE